MRITLTARSEAKEGAISFQCVLEAPDCPHDQAEALIDSISRVLEKRIYQEDDE